MECQQLADDIAQAFNVSFELGGAYALLVLALGYILGGGLPIRPVLRLLSRRFRKSIGGA